MSENTTTSAGIDEYQVHLRAFSNIFQAVLKKLPGDISVKKKRLDEVRRYVNANVKSTDKFLENIPQFAKILGVKEAPLSSFIGANFMTAVNQARDQLGREQASAPTGGNGKVERNILRMDDSISIFEQIDRITGAILTQPAHFEVIDMGYLKFISSQGEVLPVGYGGDGSAPADSVSAAPDSSSAPAAVEQQATAAPAPATATKSNLTVAGKEKNIISEILETLGSHLNITEKLDVPIFPPEESKEDGAVSEAAAPAADVVPEKSYGISTNQSNIPVKEKKLSFYKTADEPIFAEILEKLSSILNVTEKLEPSTGLEGESGAAGVLGAISEDSTGESPLSSPIGGDGESGGESSFNPIELNLVTYQKILKKLQEFKASGDANGYRQWLQGAGVAVKGVVGLQSLEGKERKGAVLNWEAEYSKLAPQVGAESAAQLQDLHNRTRCFTEIRKLIAQLQAKIKVGGAPLIAALRQIWSQLLLLAGEIEDESSYMSQLNIIMLSVTDLESRNRLQAYLRPFFQELNLIYIRAGLKSP